MLNCKKITKWHYFAKTSQPKPNVDAKFFVESFLKYQKDRSCWSSRTFFFAGKASDLKFSWSPVYLGGVAGGGEWDVTKAAGVTTSNPALPWPKDIWYCPLKVWFKYLPFTIWIELSCFLGGLRAGHYSGNINISIRKYGVPRFEHEAAECTFVLCRPQEVSLLERQFLLKRIASTRTELHMTGS